MLGSRRSAFGGSDPRRGTSTNDDAVAGFVGEFVSAVLVSGSAISLTTATTAGITSISLTAGDWDVSAVVAFVTAATTSVTLQIGGISTTSATLPTTVSYGGLTQLALEAEVPGAATAALPVPVTRISVASTTTVYLVASATFTVSTMTGYGGIMARRAR